MTGQPVCIADYDPRWPATFEELRGPIAAALGALALRIEHVGRTAVPGLAAKPIIDLDIVIGSHTVRADPDGQAGSQRKPLLFSQMMALPSPATPVIPASACGQNSPGS